jgi:hypothetical protein
VAIRYQARVGSHEPALRFGNSSKDSLVQVKAAEPGGWTLPGQPGMAMLSADGTHVTVAATMEAEKLVPVINGVTIPIGTSLPPGTPPSSGQPRLDFGAVLSAQEQAVFIVGGQDSAGQFPANLQRYNLNTSTWNTVPFTGTVPETVLSATFRYEDRSLYVVDQTSDGQFARLLRIDLSSQQSTLLGRWTRNTTTDKVFLEESNDGHLLVTSSSGRNNAWKVLSLEIASDGQMREAWSSSGTGTVAWSATRTKRGVLSVPVNGNNGVEPVLVQATQLATPARFGLDSCLLVSHESG